MLTARNENNLVGDLFRFELHVTDTYSERNFELPMGSIEVDGLSSPGLVLDEDEVSGSTSFGEHACSRSAKPDRSEILLRKLLDPRLLLDQPSPSYDDVGTGILDIVIESSIDHALNTREEESDYVDFLNTLPAGINADIEGPSPLSSPSLFAAMVLQARSDKLHEKSMKERLREGRRKPYTYSVTGVSLISFNERTRMNYPAEWEPFYSLPTHMHSALTTGDHSTSTFNKNYGFDSRSIFSSYDYDMDPASDTAVRVEKILQDRVGIIARISTIKSDIAMHHQEFSQNQCRGHFVEYSEEYSLEGLSNSRKYGEGKGVLSSEGVSNVGGALSTEEANASMSIRIENHTTVEMSESFPLTTDDNFDKMMSKVTLSVACCERKRESERGIISQNYSEGGIGGLGKKVRQRKDGSDNQSDRICRIVDEREETKAEKEEERGKGFGALHSELSKEDENKIMPVLGGSQCDLRERSRKSRGRKNHGYSAVSVTNLLESISDIEKRSDRIKTVADNAAVVNDCEISVVSPAPSLTSIPDISLAGHLLPLLQLDAAPVGWDVRAADNISNITAHISRINIHGDSNGDSHRIPLNSNVEPTGGLLLASTHSMSLRNESMDSHEQRSPLRDGIELRGKSSATFGACKVSSLKLLNKEVEIKNQTEEESSRHAHCERRHSIIDSSVCPSSLFHSGEAVKMADNSHLYDFLENQLLKKDTTHQRNANSLTSISIPKIFEVSLRDRLGSKATGVLKRDTHMLHQNTEKDEQRKSHGKGKGESGKPVCKDRVVAVTESLSLGMEGDADNHHHDDGDNHHHDDADNHHHGDGDVDGDSDGEKSNTARVHMKGYGNDHSHTRTNGILSSKCRTGQSRAEVKEQILPSSHIDRIVKLLEIGIKSKNVSPDFRADSKMFNDMDRKREFKNVGIFNEYGNKRRNDRQKTKISERGIETEKEIYSFSRQAVRDVPFHSSFPILKSPIYNLSRHSNFSPSPSPLRSTFSSTLNCTLGSADKIVLLSSSLALSPFSPGSTTLSPSLCSPSKAGR